MGLKLGPYLPRILSSLWCQSYDTRPHYSFCLPLPVSSSLILSLGVGWGGQALFATHTAPCQLCLLNASVTLLILLLWRLMPPFLHPQPHIFSPLKHLRTGLPLPEKPSSHWFLLCLCVPLTASTGPHTSPSIAFYTVMLLLRYFSSPEIHDHPHSYKHPISFYPQCLTLFLRHWAFIEFSFKLRLNQSYMMLYQGYD